MLHGRGGQWLCVGLLVVFAMVLAASLAPSASANEILGFPVSSSTDDAEELVSNGGIDIDSSDLEICEEHPGDQDYQVVGVRFTDVRIPNPDDIVEAYIQFTVDEDKNGETFDVEIQGEAGDNPGTFTLDANNLTNRSRTTASVSWTEAPDWTTAGESGANQRTPDISSILLEILGRQGWTDGNAMVFFFEGTGTRTAESYDGDPYAAATLKVVMPSEESYPVLASEDDVEELLSTGEMDLTSSDLELVDEKPNESPINNQAVGIRFDKSIIPVGAQVLSAHVQFTQDNTKTGNPFDVAIHGEAADHSEAFTADSGNISSRSKTTASVSWSNIPDWTVDHEAGENQKTPDISAIIQEIVDRPGWREGNALSLILTGTGCREAESFDGEPTMSPVLHVKFIGEHEGPSVARIRLVWNDDPSTTMTIAWDQIKGDNPKVYYGTVDHGTDHTQYANTMPPTRVEAYRGMNNHFAKLTGLTPGSTYYFVIKDSEGTSDRLWFRTAPDTPQPFTFISGGDTKSIGDALMAGRYSHQIVPKLRPLFIIFNGDFCTGSGTNDAYWKLWFDDWYELTQTDDGRLFPIIPVHGNHENGDMEVLYHLFDAGNTDTAQSLNLTYYGLSVGGNLLRIYTLNSEIDQITGALDAQTAWLTTDLQNSQDHTFRAAGFHKPFRPHTAGKSENDYLYDAWAQLFYDQNMSLGFDADAHMHKITFPVRPDTGPDSFMGFIRDDENGTMFIGEGSWGASYRDNDDDKPWTLDSGAFQQLKWIQVFPQFGMTPARMDIYTVITGIKDQSGMTVSYTDNVGSNTEATRFNLPENINLREIPNYGSVISFPFTGIEGDPPSAPINLSAQATSYTSVELTWEYADQTADAIYIERTIGTSGDWQLMEGFLPAETTSYVQEELKDSTEYIYRIRAYNHFGQSDYSEEVSVTTPEDKRLKLTFQENVDSYTGTVDLGIFESTPDFSHNDDVEMATDFNTGLGDQEQALIRFTNIFGTGTDQIPSDVHITQATLRVKSVGNTDRTISIHQMLTDWSIDATWNSLTDGVSADDTEAAQTPDDQMADLHSGEFYTFDVTTSMRYLQENASENYGWVFLNDGSDGWDLATSEADIEDDRPLLTVFYQNVTSGTGDFDGLGGINLTDVLVGLMIVTGSDVTDYVYDGYTPITGDTDANGVIDLKDLVYDLQVLSGLRDAP